MNPKNRRIRSILAFNKLKRSCLVLGDLVDCLTVGLNPSKLKSRPDPEFGKARLALLKKAKRKLGGREPRNLHEWQVVLNASCKIVQFSADRDFEVAFAGESNRKKLIALLSRDDDE